MPVTLGRDIFHSSRGAYMVAPSYREWQNRRRNSGRGFEADSAARLAEARTSLIQCLGDPELYLMRNTQVEAAAAELRSFANGNLQQTHTGREMAILAGTDMLAGLLSQQAA